MLEYQELRVARRVNLRAAVPLPAPFTVFVEATNVCNFRCTMCPESFPDYQQQAGYYRRMSPQTYEKVLAGIRAWGRIKALKFAVEGEPTLHPDLPEMLAAAVALGAIDRIEVTTNGSMLKEGFAKRLVGCGLDYLRVSVYGATDEEHRRTTGSRMPLEAILENVRTLRSARERFASRKPHIFVKKLAGTADEDRIFREMFSPVADEIGIERWHNWGGSDGRLVSIGGEAQSAGKQACPEPFYSLTVKANGDVSGCCLDWNGQLVFGNLAEQSLQEVWMGERLAELHRRHLRHERHLIPACAGCASIYEFPDNIDDLTEGEYDQRRQPVDAAV